MKRFFRKLGIGCVENGFAGFQEAVKSGHIFRGKLGNFRAGLVFVSMRLEHRAIIKADAVERIDRLECDIIFQSATTQRPKLVEEMRRCQDCRPCIEGEPVLPERVGPASRCIQLVEDRDAVAFRTQPDGSGQAAKACADNNRMRGFIV